MSFKRFIILAAFVIGGMGWEIMLFENNNPGRPGDPNNCDPQVGGTIVSGTESDCIEGLAAINVESAQVINDPQGCAFEMWTGDDCSGTMNNNQGANFCFNGLHPIGSVRVLC
ncbi:hypothetical protein M422DRAFT_247527 [Sphaerobolus stellatus SS14]|nr:hypothetical protein M422DRAFT_247527 [Sphaerobolus stellatus SS14]